MKQPNTCFLRIGLAVVAGLMASAPLWAETYTMAVHPVLSGDETRRAYQPLADYLKKRTGHHIRITTSSNFLVHWQLTKRGQYSLIVEGPHMVDYRVKKMGYTVLAKIPEVISYTLVANQDLMIMEANELVGKPVATLPSPSLGAVRLHQIFPNPLRQPALIEVDDMDKAVQQVRNGKAAGALLPTVMVSRFPDLNTVATTEQAPAPAIVASPDVSPETQRALRQALLEATLNPEGQAALQALKIARFESATPANFAGYAKLLEGMWGY